MIMDETGSDWYLQLESTKYTNFFVIKMINIYAKKRKLLKLSSQKFVYTHIKFP
jgi:hypothetical protein